VSSSTVMTIAVIMIPMMVNNDSNDNAATMIW